MRRHRDDDDYDDFDEPPARRRTGLRTRTRGTVDDGDPAAGRSSWPVVVVVPVAAAMIGAIAVVVSAIVQRPLQSKPPEARGEIVRPAADDEVLAAPATFPVELTVAEVRKSQHVWLAVQKDGRLWPRANQVVGPRWSGDVTVDELAPGERFALVLLVADPAGNRQIEEWLRRDDQSRREGLLDPIIGARRPAVVDPLVVRAPACNQPPLDCLFPQRGAGEEFKFNGGDAALASTFLQEKGCREPTRSIGLRVAYDARSGGNGGWGVQWSGASPGRFDASRFATLTLSVRGATGGENFQVGMKDILDRQTWVQAKSRKQVSAGWQRLEFPLTDFQIDHSKIESLHIGFNTSHGRGEVCIDEIAFEGTGDLPPLPPGLKIVTTGKLTCVTAPDCRFGVEGVSSGVSVGAQRIYVFVYPTDPAGEGWYRQRPVATVSANGDWSQTPSYVGNAEYPAETGHKLMLRAALVGRNATYRNVALDDLTPPAAVGALEDIQGLIALSDPVTLTVARNPA